MPLALSRVKCRALPMGFCALLRIAVVLSSLAVVAESTQNEIKIAGTPDWIGRRS